MVKGDITTVDEDKNIFTDVSTGKSITIGSLALPFTFRYTLEADVSGTGITFNGTGNGFLMPMFLSMGS